MDDHDLNMQDQFQSAAKKLESELDVSLSDARLEKGKLTNTFMCLLAGNRFPLLGQK